jgi:3-phosphoshikimate 1-carboxyvinyltransferase
MRVTISGPARRFEGIERVPGDKSISHRALLFASLAHGPSRLSGWLHAGVTDALTTCLKRLGADYELLGDDDILILGKPWNNSTQALNCQSSGTSMRLLLGALAGQGVHACLTGSPRLRQRPMARVLLPLRRMGARIDGENGGSQPPLRLRGGALHGIETTIEIPSAQVKTALLLAGLYADGPTTLVEVGPTRDHTERLLRNLGAPLTVKGRTVHLQGTPFQIPPFELSIPGDFSSAAFLIAAAAVMPGSRLDLPGVGVNPTRLGLLDVLESMGARVTLDNLRFRRGEPIADISIQGTGLLRATSVEGDMTVRSIDELPILGVIATQAEGETIVHDAGELRHKESDRISQLVSELRKLGAEIEEAPGGFRVNGPTQLRGAVVDSHGDHRLAMSLAVAGLLAEGETTIIGSEWVDQSYPGFFSAVQRLSGAIAG